MARRINVYPSPTSGRLIAINVADSMGLLDTITTPPIQPSGAGITSYQSLLAGSSNKLTNSSAATTISMPNGLTDIAVDFVQPAGAAPNGNNFGAMVSANTVGIIGSGPVYCILEITPNSMSATTANKIPSQAAGGTNPIHIMRLNGSTYLANLTVQATPQFVNGAYQLYGGVYNYQQSNANHHDVVIKGVPGNNSANPGETFTWNEYQCTSNSYTNVELDGRDSNGIKVAATLQGINRCTDADFTDCYWHDAQYGYGSSIWQSTGVYNFTRVRSEGNLVPYNFEKNGATTTIINMYNCTYMTPHRTSEQPVHMIADSDLGSMKMNIYDPVYTSLAAYPGKFVMQLHNTYNGVANRQLVSDIKIWQGGIDVTSSLLQIVH